jgi:lipoprotein-anchoring transpeptidase ErfK/SrfK
MTKKISMKYKVFAIALVLCALTVPHFTHADTLDTDNDGLQDDQETQIYFTDPLKSDTDADGYIDGDEIKNGYSPLHAHKKLSEVDSDTDGLVDSVEIALTTNISKQDTDSDGISDGKEAFAGYNPLKGDKDRSLPKRVEVDLTTQQLSYYLNDVKLGSMPVSSGLVKTPTPNGEFKILRKVPAIRYKGEGYDYPNTKWNLEFKRSYYIHGAYWHNQFGIRPMSHGCLNMAYKDVERLYTFLDVGDKVKVTGKAPRKVAVTKKT